MLLQHLAVYDHWSSHANITLRTCEHCEILGDEPGVAQQGGRQLAPVTSLCTAHHLYHIPVLAGWWKGTWILMWIRETALVGQP